MCILNIIEINILYNILYFVIIVITIGYILYIYNIIYISMILIIVYSTALVILLGFVIMKNKNYYPITYNNISNYIPLLIIIILYSTYTLSISNSIDNSINNIGVIDIDIIYKIGDILYNDKIYRIIVILSAIILLFPIIGLIYI